ncbi:MAG: ABC transporter ATP-binding protein [Planctomycetota bacterium]|jgi:ABC-2 type transport system ATP-binding protein|nr:ABC transporter ATP-binding protein [Planctomycetota bacterium]
MQVVEVNSLCKQYEHIQALENLSFTMEGGAVGLLGPNGAGKSTLIKILLGFLSPTSGDAALFGLDVRTHSLKIRQKIGYMPENESFLPGMTAVSYVRLAGRLVGMTSREAMQRTHMVLNYLGMGEERYRNIEGYSSGMKQKVKFAQALVHHPQLLLLDEPTSGLDPHAREEMLGIIREVAHGKGIHVLLSTHILPDVEAVCDSVVILDKGRKVIQDQIQNLISTAGNCHYELRIDGEEAPFRALLEKSGVIAEEKAGGLLLVTVPEGKEGTNVLFQAALDSGVQIRHLAHPRKRLDELFAEQVVRT